MKALQIFFQSVLFTILRVVGRMDHSWIGDLRVASCYGVIAAEYRNLNGEVFYAWDRGPGLNAARAFGEDLRAWGQWVWALKSGDQELTSGLRRISTLRQQFSSNRAVTEMLDRFSATICTEMKARGLIEEVKIAEAI